MSASALLNHSTRGNTQCCCTTPASLTHRPPPANLFEVALLVGPLLRVLVVDDVQRRLPLLQLQAFDLRLQLVELLLQVFALLHVLHPEGEQGRRSGGGFVVVSLSIMTRDPRHCFSRETRQLTVSLISH